MEDNITFIVPNYNYSNYLGYCIDSVCKQVSCKPNIIVYDDGSIDNSLDVINKALELHKDRFSGIQVIEGKQNKGKLHGLNVVLPLVETEFVSILDSDDLISPFFCQETIPLLQQSIRENNKTGFVYTDCHMIDQVGRYVGRGNSEPFDSGLLRISSYIPENAPTRTSILQGILPLDTSIRVSTKHHKWLKLVNSGYFGVYLKKPLFDYRMHKKNMSNIGNRVSSEIKTGVRQERMLSDYWQAVKSRNI
jgi:glycosyltransferase involved in cell wall biosynthesis